jgi:tryptophan synthase beta chain
MVLSATDNEALVAAHELIQEEGIIPALESAHALAALPKLSLKTSDSVVVTVSGRGDKDINQLIDNLKF